MNAIIGFLAVSALAGLVLGLGLLERHPNELYFGLAAIVVSGLILAISAAAILQNIDFGFLEGIAIIVLMPHGQPNRLSDWRRAGEPRSGGPIRYSLPEQRVTAIARDVAP